MASKDDDLFAEAVIARKFLTSEQIEDCRKAQEAMKELGIDKPLSSVAVDKGYMTEEQVSVAHSDMGRDDMPSEIGDYEIITKIGEGGMGSVYKAKWVPQDMIVALKVLPEHMAKDKSFVTRFRREASQSIRLDHPNIVKGLDVGDINGYYYFAMEFVDGETLRDKMKREGMVKEKDALDIMLQMARALEYANEQGLVHRDIKPDNVFLSKDGTAKLGDLGLAKTMDAEQTVLTLTGMAVGTAYYISPEQARGEHDVDIRSDIYSLGATIYHTTVGQAPFIGSSAAVVMTKHLTDDLPSPKERNPHLSDNFCMILQKMLAKAPENRYQTPGQLIVDLNAAIEGSAPPSAILDAVRDEAKPKTERTATPQPGHILHESNPVTPLPTPPVVTGGTLTSDQKFKLLLTGIIVGGIVILVTIITLALIFSR